MESLNAASAGTGEQPWLLFRRLCKLSLDFVCNRMLRMVSLPCLSSQYLMDFCFRKKEDQLLQ